MKAPQLTYLIATLALSSGCGDDSGAATGSEGGPCHPNGTCNPGLVCQSDFCVTGPACAEGDTQPCECPGGLTGEQVCLTDQSWADCDCPSADCGNGEVDAGEACDGSSLDGATCVSEGYGGGILACGDTCALDASGCDPCGNDVIDPNEACDGSDLDGNTCADQGYYAGTLACGTSCAFDTSGCTDCGNGIVDSVELCDGLDLGGEDCASHGFTMGELVCDSSCGFDTTGCINCTETAAGPLQVPLDMIVLLDRSGSMLGNPWLNSKSALDQFFNDPDSAGINVGLSFFPPPVGNECDASSYDPPQTPLGILPGHATTLYNAMDSTSPGGMTPTYGALLGTLQFATAHKDLNPNHAVVVILATDGDPTSCDTSIPNIASLASSAYNYNGVITHGIAIAGATITTIDQITQAGGGQTFDVTSDITLFEQAMHEIRSQATGCEFEFPSTVSDPLLLNIDYVPSVGSTVRLGQALDLADCGTNPGWYYDDPSNPVTILLCPETCNSVLADIGATLETAVGCPSVLN